jgi:hypothetical protein
VIPLAALRARYGLGAGSVYTACSSGFRAVAEGLCNIPCRTYVPSEGVHSLRAMFHGRNDLGQRVVDGVDLVLDFATLGEYGLETRAEGSARRRTDRHPRPDRRPGWEAPARAPRSACGTSNFRAAVDRYAA